MSALQKNYVEKYTSGTCKKNTDLYSIYVNMRFLAFSLIIYEDGCSSLADTVTEIIIY